MSTRADGGGRGRKDRDYRHQTVTPSRNGLRRQWPRRKAAPHRARRRAWSAHLAELAGDAEPAETAETRAMTAHFRHEDHRISYPQSWHATERAALRLIARLDSFLDAGYDPARHRAPIAAALRALVRPTLGRHGAGQVTVDLVDLLVSEHSLRRRRGPWSDTPAWRRRRAFLAAFLADQPKWGTRLRAWLLREHRRAS